MIKSRKVRWVGNVALMGEIQDLVGKPAKSPPEIQRRKYQDNIKLYLKKQV
jgi:hypothetical protein